MGRKWLSICLVVMLLFGGATGTIFALDEMYVYYLDVGQAESTLLKGPDFVILIDAGDRGKTDVLEHLERLGVEAIDLFIVTHPHADHMGQAVEVLETFEVVEVDTNTPQCFLRNYWIPFWLPMQITGSLEPEKRLNSESFYCMF